MTRQRDPVLPYFIPWELLYDGLRLLYPIEHHACRWVFAMWSRATSDEWPRDAPWWGAYRFDPDEPSYVWPRSTK
jgi:hypothetical protein